MADIVCHRGRPDPTGSRRGWSRGAYKAYPEILGLYYPSSMYANQPAAALYERAKPLSPPPELPRAAVGSGPAPLPEEAARVHGLPPLEMGLPLVRLDPPPAP